jgi:Protein of unknown function (DUF1579)
LTQQLLENQQQPINGQEALFQDSLLENLSGEWMVSRKIRNLMEENRARVEWILNHQFLQLHMIDVKAPPEYEALVMIGYEHENQRYVIHWLDVFGGQFSEKGFGTRDGNSIRFIFRYPDGLPHNTFTWNEENQTWRSIIEQQDEEGQWLVLAEDTFQRTR